MKRFSGGKIIASVGVGGNDVAMILDLEPDVGKLE